MLLAVLPVLTAVPFAAAAEADQSVGGITGSCKWSYDADTLTLTISGTGQMDDYVGAFQTSAPWGSLCFRNLVIEEGVTRIGFCAFQGCVNLTSIVIPENVTSIGTNAFFGCTSLTNIVIPKSVTYLGDNVYYGCTNLRSVVISKGMYPSVSLSRSITAAIPSVDRT